MEEEGPDARALRDGNQPSVAQSEISLCHGLITDGCVPLAGQRNAAHGSTNEDCFQISAMLGAARIPFDDLAQGAAKFDFQNTGIGKTMIQAESFRARRSFRAKSGVFRRAVLKDPRHVDERFHVVHDSGLSE